MIIDAINVYSAAETGISAQLFAELSLSDVDETHEYILEDVTGLDPEQIGPVYSGGDSASGARYYDMVCPPRTIGMRIKLNPQFGVSTYSSLRDAFYKLIWKSRTSQVELRFMSAGTVAAVIKGLTVKFEAPTFTSAPYIVLTLWCPYGLFQAQNTTSLAHAAIHDTLNRYIIDDDVSTAPHGFKMTIEAMCDLNYVLIQGLTGYTTYPFKIDKAFADGDKIYFSSEQENRYLYYTTAAAPTVKKHIADKIDANQIWPIIFPGENKFTIDAPSPTELSGDLGKIISFTHKYHFWGV